MKRLSIKLRITFWFALLMTLSIAACIIFLLSEGGKRVQNQSAYQLVQTVQEFADEIEFDDGKLEFDDDIEVYQDGIYLSAYKENGSLLYGWVPDDFPENVHTSPGQVKSVDGKDSSWYVYDLICIMSGYSEEIHVRGIALTASAGTAFSVLKSLSAIALPFFVLIAAVGGYFIACRAFRPVKRISLTAKHIAESGDLTARIGLGNGKDEIYTLASTFDRMFDRLQTAFENEKRFTSDVSHELRTPTAVILSECEFALENAKTPEELKGTLNRVSEQAQKISSLISQLLILARADNGQQKLQCELINFSELIQVICEQQREYAEKRQIIIDTDVEEDLMIFADQTLLMRLMINLIENAIKYGKAGGHIIVSLHENEAWLVGKVTDDGIGISSEHLDKIWDRFYQVDPARNPNEEGAGLGLSMVKWIVEAHGGKISVESTVHEGSSFTFKLPQKII